MEYHSFKLSRGLRYNIRVFICKIFGHRINDDPSDYTCGRCKLSYEDCYYPKNYYIESGLIDINKKEIAIQEDYTNDRD